MPKQNLYSVMKLPTAKIHRKAVKVKNEDGKKVLKEPLEFNLGNYTYDDALANNEIVSIGDNLVFQKIREYYGNKKSPLETYEEIQNIRKEIKDIKNKPNSEENKQKLIELNSKLSEVTFVKDIINVKVANKEHYKKIAMSYFTVNGVRYKRLCCGSGQLRRNIVTFVNEDIYDYLLESLMCGLNNKIEKITLSKLSAYFALAFSSVLWVRTPRICVIPDFETVVKDQKIDFIFTDNTGKKVVKERQMNLALNSSDGEGLITPECAKLFSEDMGLDYTACQFVVRAPFVKGCLLTFDFPAYAKEVCGVSKIKSIYGEEFDIDEIDVLLTESMFKMNKHYKSVKEYVDFHSQYNLKWGVARYNKKYDDDYSLLNYQYIQNNNLSVDDIDELIAPTVDWFNKICSGDKLYSLLYAIGCQSEFDKFDDVVNNCGSLYTKAIVKNSKLLDDGYVKRKLYQSIKESFRQAKIGRVWSRGGYQFMLSDPIPLIRNALGLDAKGLIPANQVYSSYWNKYNLVEIDLCRSPMVDRHEHNIVTLAQSTEMDKWYQYLYTGIVYSIYDLGTIRASDADFDGDIVYSTDNSLLINGAYRYNNPITYEKPKAPEKAVTYENIVLCDIDGLDTLVGEITNKSTSITAMLPNFPEDKYPKQNRTLINRLKLLREIIGSEIDKIKLGVSPEFPKEWIERIKVDDTDSDIDKSEKYEHNSLVICKKAYFMIYLYDNLLRAYLNHKKQFDLDCKNRFGMSYLDLKYAKNKSKSQQHFIKKAEYFSPVLDTTCIMNILCHKIEKIEDTIKYGDDTNNSVLHSFNKKLFTIEEERYKQIEVIYKTYKSQKNFAYYRHLFEQTLAKDAMFEYLSSVKKSMIKDFQERCYTQISSNAIEVFEYMMKLSESITLNGKIFDYSFVWEILDESILDIIPKENSLICIEDENGQEYLGRNYILKEVE